MYVHIIWFVLLKLNIVWLVFTVAMSIDYLAFYTLYTVLKDVVLCIYSVFITL